jgi:hypothetical protein
MACSLAIKFFSRGGQRKGGRRGRRENGERAPEGRGREDGRRRRKEGEGDETAEGGELI